MAINFLELVPNKNYGFQLTAPDLSVDLLTLNLVDGTCTSTYFNDPEITQFQRAALELFAVVAPPERAPGALNMLNRLLAVVPVDDAALTLSAVVVGNLATLRATINTNPGSILAHVPYSSDGALAWAGGNAGGGGGGAVNAVSGTFPITSSGGVAPDIALTLDTTVTDSLEVLPSGLAVNFDPDAGLQSTVGNGLQVKPGLLEGIAFNLAGEVIVSADPNYYDFSFGPGGLTPLDSGVVAGTYGDATNVPQVQVDAKGRVTGVVNVPISIPPAGVSAVTASAPVTSSGGATPNIALQAGTASGDVLTWNGAAWVSSAIPAGGVTNVTASSPIASSGGATPNITLNAGTLAGDVLTWNGASWVSSPVPAGSTVSLLNDVFVAKNGNDVTGDGSASKPFATVTAAMASITTAAPNNRFAIRVSAGDYTEPGAISLKPDVFIVGDGWENTYINTTGIALDASWTPGDASFSGLYDIAINGPTTINFVPSTSVTGRFNAVNTRFDDDLTVTAFSDSNIIGIVRCVTGGGIIATYNGGDVFSFGTLYQGPINVGESATAAQTYLTSMNDTFNGTLTATNAGGTPAGDFVVIVLGSSLGYQPGNPNARQNAIFNGQVILRATSNFVPDAANITLAGGATLEQWSFATGVGYEPAVPGNWLVAPTEVSGALDELAARAASAGTVTAVTATGPLASSGGNTPDISITAGTAPGDVLTWTGLVWAASAPAAGVTAVTATGPLASSGGATPDISLTGIVPVANGGTNASSFTPNGVVVADGTGTTLVDVVGTGSGEVLTWNGSAWTSAALPGGGVASVTASSPLASSGGANPDISLTGVVGVANGGTGLSTAPAVGALLVGNGAGYAQLVGTAGTGISITPGVGTLTIANTGVTSVTASAPLASSGGATPDISLTAGTNPNDVLTWNGAAWTSAAPSGGLVNWTEGTTTYLGRVINDFSVLNAAASVDAALVAKNQGATVAQIADGTATRGDNRGNYATDWQKSRSNANQVASGDYSTVGGGQENRASATDATVAGGRQSHASGVSSFIGGGFGQVASGSNSTVGGGSNNTASGDYTFVGGGFLNGATGTRASVVGGQNNTAAGDFSSVVGGYYAATNAYVQVAGGTYPYSFPGASASAFVSTDALLTLGNGSGGGPSASNALALLKNGYLGLGLGQNKPEDMVHAVGNVRNTGAIVQDGFTSGAAINAGQVCYLAADGFVYPAQSNNTTTSTVVGIAVETVGAGGVEIALATFNKTGGLSGLTTGTEYFLSATSAGAVVDYTTLSATSGAQIVSLGYARSATEIQLSIQRRGVTP